MIQKIKGQNYIFRIKKFFSIGVLSVLLLEELTGGGSRGAWPLFGWLWYDFYILTMEMTLVWGGGGGIHNTRSPLRALRVCSRTTLLCFMEWVRGLWITGATACQLIWATTHKATEIVKYVLVNSYTERSNGLGTLPWALSMFCLLIWTHAWYVDHSNSHQSQQHNKWYDIGILYLFFKNAVFTVFQTGATALLCANVI